ncbi:MAG TPA: hypothetical protein VGH19_24205 [Verrucomicrobiae bacterium]
MKPLMPSLPKKAVIRYACLAAVLLAISLWMLHWIARGPLDCLRWRFTTHDGKVLHDEIWFATVSPLSSEPWNSKISTLSGLLEISVPVSDNLPWYQKPFQSFRPIKRIPYRDGLIHGSVILLNEASHETHIQQYRGGKEHGIDCLLNPDGSLSHLVSSKNGMLDGPRIDCWTNGLLSEVEHFSSNKRNGFLRKWSETGRLIEEAISSDYRHSWWLHHNGAKSNEIKFSTNGTPSETMIWAADGKLIGKGTYKEDQVWDHRYSRPWNGYFVDWGKLGINPQLEYYKEGVRTEHTVEWLEKSTNP